MRLLRCLVLAVVLIAIWAVTSVFGQTVTGDRLRLNAGTCIVTSTATGPKVILETCPDITTATATNLTLSPTGDLVLNPTGNDVLPDANYDINLGMLSKKYLTLHAAELWVETLVAQNTIATIGGRVLVAPTNILTVDLAAAGTTISVKYNNLNNGDRVYMEADGKLEFMAVASGSSGSGPYTYTVTRNLDGSGANDWFAGDAVLNTGTTGNGFIDLYSTAGVLSTGSGPSIVGNVRTGTTYNAYAPRWAIGNLNGLYGYGADTYGAAFGDASATNVTVDATNGFRIRNSTTNKFVADTSGNLSIVGDMSVGTAGVIRSNKTACNTGTGWWMSYNSGTPEFCIGVPGAAGLTWDGTSLVVRGTGGSATNVLRNSDCGASTETYSHAPVGHGLSTTFSFGLDPWDLNNAGGTCYIQTIGTPANATFDFILGDLMPAVAGARYEVSAYLGIHGTSGVSDVYIAFYDDTATYISEAHGVSCASGAGTGGYFLSGYCRSGVVATAPVNTAFIQFVLSRTYTGAATDPATFWVRAFLGEATSTQTELSAWGPPGATIITGGLIQTGTIVASHIAADTITASQIAANAITTSEINASAVTAAKIAAGTITATQIAAGTITATQIAAGTITATQIAAGTITATELAADSVTASKIDVSSLSAISANIGTITAGTITGITINGTTINGGTISIGSGNFSVGSSGDLFANTANANTVNVTNINMDNNVTLESGASLQLQNLPGTATRFLCIDAAEFVFASASACTF